MSRFIWAILPILAAGSSVAEAENPNFMALGDLPGGSHESHATAVSADGTTVVGWSNSGTFDPAGGHEAFRWRDGQLVGLGAFPYPSTPLRFSRATGVNGDGTIVVGDSRMTVGYTPFKYQAGSMTAAFIEESYAGQMSTNSNFAVTSTFGPGWYGFRATPTANNSIPILPGGSASGSFGVRVFGISSDGNTVIGRSDSASGVRPIRWTPSGGTRNLGSLPGGSDCTPTAVSGLGSIIVGHCTNGIFKWTNPPGMLPFNIPFAPVAMSDDGTIMVGGGLVWDQQNGARSLKSLLAGYGIDMSAWSSLNISDISADGTVVVGDALRSDMVTTEAFRAVIPEPVSIIGLLIGSLLIPRRRRS